MLKVHVGMFASERAHAYAFADYDVIKYDCAGRPTIARMMTTMKMLMMMMILKVGPTIQNTHSS